MPYLGMTMSILFNTSSINMKKILLCLSMLVILQSCFWSSESTLTWLSLQESEEFSIQIPESWGAVSQADIPTPKSWEVALAYSSNSERQGYLNNIVVLSTPSKSSETSDSLMKNSIQSLQNDIENFKIIEEKTVSFLDSSSWIIVSYSGKYNTTTPQATYIQTARICWDNNYYLTLSLTENLENYDRYEYILQTFTCN